MARHAGTVGVKTALAVRTGDRRDYPFVLYPEATLRPFCEQFLTAVPAAAPVSRH